MTELLETIKIEDGQVRNIEWHNQRCNRSRRELFNESTPLKLETFIDAPKEGLYRCRILYEKDINSLEYIPYTPKEINSFKIVQSTIDYSYKYSNREELNALLEPNYDEIIIEKNGLLTDTSIANIAFFDGEQWITPKKPLLHGTTRAKLLSEEFLTERDIKSETIQDFSHFALMNAMIGFQITENITITPYKEKPCHLKT